MKCPICGGEGFIIIERGEWGDNKIECVICHGDKIVTLWGWVLCQIWLLKRRLGLIK